MSLERPLVLVADDDAAIVELVCTLVRADGMDAIGARDGQEALRLFADCGPDLVILDLMMPVMDGFEACEQIRHLSPGVPIVFLSAKDGESDKVVGLTLGADDYVTKPFRPRELMARIHARLRAARIQDPDRPELSVGALELDPVSHKARLLGKDLQLTPTEFRLLQELLRAGGEPVSVGELFERVWDAPADQSAKNTVMVHIRRLRGKLERVDASEEYIQTVWGVGYRVLGDVQ